MLSERVTGLFAAGIRRRLEREPLEDRNLYEIRLRVNRPVLLIYEGGEYFLNESGGLTVQQAKGYTASAADLRESLEYAAGYSLYAFEEELRQGFLTVPGGHRIGVAGRIFAENGQVRGIQDISFLNFRLAHEVLGCADAVLPYLTERGAFVNTLLISPPRCGKTTLLRDLVRQISDGYGAISGSTVGLVDERSEIAGCCRGIPQMDVGMRTDILDACPKAVGMRLLVRSMAPQLVAVDELGADEELPAVEAVLHSGCRLLATVHGSSPEDVRRAPLLKRLLDEGIFRRLVVLEKRGRAGIVQGIYDGAGKQIKQNKG